MSPQQKIQLVVFLIVAGSGVLRVVFQKLQEKAAAKRKLDEIERRKQEVLRTGRDTITTAPTVGAQIARRQKAESAQRQQAEAERRRAQIEEFRRRQLERARQRAEAGRAPPATPPPPLVFIPGSTGPTVPFPAPRRAGPMQRPKAPATKPQPQRAAQPRPAVPKGRAAPERASQAQGPARAAPTVAPPQLASQAAAQPQPSAAADVLRLSGPPRTIQEWRRAIVVNEILSAPVSDRPTDAPSPF